MPSEYLLKDEKKKSLALMKRYHCQNDKYRSYIKIQCLVTLDWLCNETEELKVIQVLLKQQICYI